MKSDVEEICLDLIERSKQCGLKFRDVLNMLLDNWIPEDDERQRILTSERILDKIVENDQENFHYEHDDWFYDQYDHDDEA